MEPKVSKKLTAKATFLHEDMHVGFNYRDSRVEADTITFTIATEYGDRELSVRVTPADDTASVEDKLREAFRDEYTDLSSYTDYLGSQTYDVQAEQGYGCTGQLILH